MKKATPIKDIEGWKADATLYRLSEPLQGHHYVIVSALGWAFDTGDCETYIFPADEDGKVRDWGELHGSAGGICDQAAALRNAGYEVEIN